MSKQEIKTSISAHLQELINNANSSIQTLKSQILEIYETAKLEGFSPLEARMLIEVKIVKVSDVYLRKVLPAEAKDQSKVRNQKEVEEDEDENEEFEEEKPEDFAIHVSQIPAPATEIKDAETVPDKDHESTKEEIPTPQQLKENVTFMQFHNETVERLTTKISQLEEDVTKLRMKQVGTIGNKFDFEYDFEMPSGDIVPFLVTVFPDKKDGYIRLNKEKIEANEAKEAKKK